MNFFNCFGSSSNKHVFNPSETRNTNPIKSKPKQRTDVNLDIKQLDNELRLDTKTGLNYYSILYKDSPSRLYFFNSEKKCTDPNFKATFINMYEEISGKTDISNKFKEESKKHGGNAVVRPCLITTEDRRAVKVILCRKDISSESIDIYPFSVIDRCNSDGKNRFVMPIGWVEESSLSVKQKEKYNHIELFEYAGEPLDQVILDYDELDTFYEELIETLKFLERNRISGLDGSKVANFLYLRNEDQGKSKIKMVDIDQLHIKGEGDLNYDYLSRVMLTAMSRSISRHSFNENPDELREDSTTENPANDQNLFRMYERCCLFVDSLEDSTQKEKFQTYLNSCKKDYDNAMIESEKSHALLENLSINIENINLEFFFNWT
ncbi:hypothetical protein HOG98_04150 [bacterium]|jgi:hypothetical protein|nr:hypothetical protein [bacterium]